MGHILRFRNSGAEYTDSIVHRQARFIVVGGDLNFWDHPPIRQALSRELPMLDSLLRANYFLDTSIGSYDVYRIKNDS